MQKKFFQFADWLYRCAIEQINFRNIFINVLQKSFKRQVGIKKTKSFKTCKGILKCLIDVLFSSFF